MHVFLVSNSMSYKGEIDIGIRLHSRTWTSFFFRRLCCLVFKRQSFEILFCLTNSDVKARFSRAFVVVNPM
jgi:hypothetical protein